MEKEKKKFDLLRPEQGEVFPDSDPELEDLRELNVEPFTESDIFLDKNLNKKKSS